MRRKRVLAFAGGLLALVAAGTGTGFAMERGSAGNEVVCQGVALTFSAEGGAPGITSNQFPVGTRLKVTNLDNNKSITAPVTGVSGSCALLNATAMDAVREPGKNLIRRNRVERVGGSAGAPQAGAPQAGAPQNNAGGSSGRAVCQGAALTFAAGGSAAGATSNQFPVGTRLKVTNLDNNKSVTVPITGVSGSCVLLNETAMEAVREPGKNLIRRNRVELVGSAPQAGAPLAGAPQAGAPQNNGGASGQVVCAGSTVTLSGEGGAPAASSNQFPAGTRLKVTNLDNNKSTTVSVTGVSGSCTLLNNAAFEQVREPGKFLIRRARIERVG
jgi:hypothetical protein